MSSADPALHRCYRHPDREAGRSCTRCGKPACSDCLVQAQVGSHCLDCAKAGRPDVKTRAKLASSRLLTPVTYSIIAINVAVFMWMGSTDSQSFAGTATKLHGDLGLSKTILQGLSRWDSNSAIYPAHQWYRLITSGFIHFGLFHLAMNMLLLFQLGKLLERVLGTVRFSLLYTASLLAGSLGVLLVDGGALTGGASGAVFGLMAGAAVGLHRRGINVFSTGIGMTLVLNLVLTFSIRGISIGGHVGGAIAGAVLGWLMLAPSWKPVPKWATYAAPVAVMLVAVVGAIVVVG